MSPTTLEKNRIRAAHWRKDNPLRWAFAVQRQNARRRGVEFLFTFSEWIRTWGDNIERRGKAAEELCRARFNDAGPYSPDNVEIITNRQNNRMQQLGA